MILIDNTKGKYRFILRCDGCGQQIKDLSSANAKFVDQHNGQLQLSGVFCKERCVHKVLGDDDTWELHQVWEFLSRGLVLNAKLAKWQIARMDRIIP